MGRGTPAGAVIAAPDGRIYVFDGLNTFLAPHATPATTPTPTGAQLAPCRFVLGFQSIHNAIPAVVGNCLENEQHNPANGDALQHTTNGLPVWRKHPQAERVPATSPPSTMATGRG